MPTGAPRAPMPWRQSTDAEQILRPDWLPD